MELVAIIIALIVPIGVAIWTVRSSAKDTAKQIAALEESTTKQIESIKELARIQIEITSIQLQKELTETRQSYLQASEKNMDAINNRFSMMGIPHNEVIARMQDKQEQQRNLSLERDFYSKKINWTDSYLKRVKELKMELEKA
jgi:hypothetical protein